MENNWQAVEQMSQGCQMMQNYCLLHPEWVLVFLLTWKLLPLVKLHTDAPWKSCENTQNYHPMLLNFQSEPSIWRSRGKIRVNVSLTGTTLTLFYLLGFFWIWKFWKNKILLEDQAVYNFQPTSHTRICEFWRYKPAT